MFREPLRRDPLVVGWALVMAVASFVALNNNTEWSGHLEPDLVAGFLKDLAEAFLWSFFLLLLLAWLRARGWRSRTHSPRRAHGSGSHSGSGDPAFTTALPWTDRWLRDWREDEAQQRRAEPSASRRIGQAPVVCRHGVPVDESAQAEQLPVLRALSVSHHVVQPGHSVSVTWCFASCDAVEVDGGGGYPPCGEALVPIERTRRVEVVGHNRHGPTPAATATVVAVVAPQLHLPTVASPPAVSLRTDVWASVQGRTSMPITQRLDDFWVTQDNLRPRLTTPKGLIGVPRFVTDRLRGTRRDLRGMQK